MSATYFSHKQIQTRQQQTFPTTLNDGFNDVHENISTTHLSPLLFTCCSISVLTLDTYQHCGPVRAS